jgi:hypothetical protein
VLLDRCEDREASSNGARQRNKLWEHGCVLDNGGPWVGTGVAILSKDGKSARNSKTGQNYAKEPDGCWIDIKTGKRVPTVPANAINYGNMVAVLDNGGPWVGTGVAVLSKDGKSARNSKTGQNYALEPCPPPGEATGDTLKKVFDSVHIGIGIGTGGGQKHTDDQKKP